MSVKTNISNALRRAEQKARSSKWRRWTNAPVRYPLLLVFNKVLYPILGKGVMMTTSTFFGTPFKTLLPSGTDIILNGMKGHDSEIRLSKFLVYHLKDDDTFIDVGAHYGYYSLLASVLVGSGGKVFSIEASVNSFALLAENTSEFSNIRALKNAASDYSGKITFYEYPGPLAEYNTTIKDAYINASWYNKEKETVNTVGTIMLDQLISDNYISKATVKIDAEGGELAVVKGMLASLKEKELIIIMEYLLSENSDSLHQQAVDLFKQYHYSPHAIRPDGTLMLVDSIDHYLTEAHLNSDNLVFIKS